MVIYHIHQLERNRKSVRSVRRVFNVDLKSCDENFSKLTSSLFKNFFTGAGRVNVAVGKHLPAARSFTDIENGQISTGGRPGSDLHIWVVVPSPGPKATAQRRQAATRCWPGCFFAAIHPPAPTTLWPLNTLASQPAFPICR